MQDQLSWDPALVKKFGSSNHFKLLNQLRTEIKKYPIKRNNNNNVIDKSKSIIKSSNKKLSISDSTIINASNNSEVNNQNLNTIYKSYHDNELSDYKSNADKTIKGSETVIISDSYEIQNVQTNIQDHSFNTRVSNIFNNNLPSDYSNKENINDTSVNKISTEKSSVSKTFKERLNQIDMK